MILKSILDRLGPDVYLHVREEILKAGDRDVERLLQRERQRKEAEAKQAESKETTSQTEPTKEEKTTNPTAAIAQPRKA